MKPFHIKFDGTEAIISATFEFEGQWRKKSLRARDKDELWAGMEALLKIEELEPEQRAEAKAVLSKAQEHEALETAILAFLAKGGIIKEYSQDGGKLTLTQEDKDEILLDLGFEDEVKYA